MSEVVTVITCTGHRPEALKLCYKYLYRQTWRGPIQWIIVDDSGADSLPEDFNPVRSDYMSRLGTSIFFVKGPRLWEEGLNTHRFNMEAALPHIEGDYILFFEDDDYFKPDFIEKYVSFLRYCEVVGEANAKYYHLAIPGHKEMRNVSHASLVQTGIRKEALPMLKRAIDSGNMYFDIELWKEVHAKKVPTVLFESLDLCIGIKGMPGRAGIGAGHREKDYLVDLNLTKLKEWLGDDAEAYREFTRYGKKDKKAPWLQSRGEKNPGGRL